MKLMKRKQKIPNKVDCKQCLRNYKINKTIILMFLMINADIDIVRFLKSDPIDGGKLILDKYPGLITFYFDFVLKKVYNR